MGYKVSLKDKILFDNRLITPEKKEYVLLNKPKDFITTTRDERGRRTVMNLIDRASKSRLLPVGRLDRNTTGLLLFTNDGDLAKKLTHPKHNIKKLYHAILNANLKHKDLKKIRQGIELEDGFIKADAIDYVNNSPKSEVGIEIHSGKNRIVRRIFESLGYHVIKLDRVVFAGITKKDLPRSHWRFLTEREVAKLKTGSLHD
ncbi:pseudouridine synthase [Elysia marginata]|uniref:Pseudouridine synthase n=1 Tax=Elysia marginata TaxID=1093978 RepID=A0AAV4F0I2_9GAST|nr:pseudouridine synthase [Elysia marginata]